MTPKNLMYMFYSKAFITVGTYVDDTTIGIMCFIATEVLFRLGSNNVRSSILCDRALIRWYTSHKA